MPLRTSTIEETAGRVEPMPLYHTVIHNCSCHTFDYGIGGLMRIIGIGLADARRKATEVDFFGSGIVATTSLEVAELYSERLRNEVISASGTLLRTSIQRV